MNNWDEVFDCGILITLNISRWGARKTLKRKDLNLEEIDSTRRKKLINLGNKKLLDPSKLDAFLSIEKKARKEIRQYGIPFPAVKTSYFVADSAFIELKTKLDLYRDEFYNVLDSFVESFEDHKKDWLDEYFEYAREELSPCGEDRDVYARMFVNELAKCYPKNEREIREKFGFRYVTFTITAPADRIDPEEYIDHINNRREIQRHYNTQVKNQIDGFLEKTVSGLRKELIETCEHVSELLTDDDKQLKSTSLISMRNRMEKFKRLNFAGDERVNQVLEELEDYVGVDAVEYRDDSRFANQFGSVLNKIGSDLRATLEVEVKEVVTNFGESSKRKLKLKKKKKVSV